MGQHGGPDTVAPRGFGDVHRLDLCVLCVEALDRPDAQEAAVRPEAEQGDRRIEQPGHIKSEAVFRRGLGERKLQMPAVANPARLAAPRCRIRSTITFTSILGGTPEPGESPPASSHPAGA